MWPRSWYPRYIIHVHMVVATTFATREFSAAGRWMWKPSYAPPLI